MSKRIKMRFSKARRGIEHLDPSVDLSTVEAHGYEPRYMPKGYLTLNRWYYVTGAIIIRGERRVIGVPAQATGFDGNGVHFLVTQAVLDSLDIEGTPEANHLILGKDDFCHVFKYKPRPAVDKAKEQAAQNGLDLALNICKHAEEAARIAREGVAAAVTRLNEVRGY